VFRNLSDMRVFDRLCHPGGAFDPLADAVKAGKCPFRGLSSHGPDTLRAALTTGVCDIVLFPVGPFVDERYVTDTMPLARSLSAWAPGFRTLGAAELPATRPGATGRSRLGRAGG
jgi:1-deoxyxylulose-5-phosphate synthase